MSTRPARTVPRVTLRLPEAATSLGVSVEHFNRHIRPSLRVVRSGAIELFPVAELEKWADRAAEMEIGGRR